MTLARKPRTLVEYGSPINLAGEISAHTGMDVRKVRDLILSAGERARLVLGFNDSPIQLGPNWVRAIDMAGLIRLAPNLELEIAPKFLGGDAYDAKWREDFFFLATLSRHGRLLESERLHAKSGSPQDLPSLVARAMTRMYWDNHRRPLRSYRKKKENDFFLDGDVDPESILLPETEGYAQETIRYDRRNVFNSAILAAAKELIPDVRDPGVLAQLERMAQTISPQSAMSSPRHRRLPSRACRWQPLHDLSVDVLNGLGITYEGGLAKAPGYIVNTWRVWEDLLTIAMRIGFDAGRLKSQHSLSVGKRFRLGSTPPEQKPLNVKPDLIVSISPATNVLVVDAKYKGHVEKKDGLRIAEADLYESSAFAKGAKCDTVILVYPAQPKGTTPILGEVVPFEEIEMDSVRVIGVEVEVRTIASRGGLKRFSERVRDGLIAVANAAPASTA